MPIGGLGISSDASWAPSGKDLRNDGTRKGRGFFGALKRPDGKVSTEISVGVDFGSGEQEIPLLVPTLAPEEVQWLLNYDASGKGDIPPTILKKAVEHARGRIKSGMSPFAD
jgi:hypothetical protein